MAQRVADALEVKIEIIRNHVELVGGRELDVPPRVGEQLREFSLFRLKIHDLVGQGGEEGGCPRPGGVGTGGDDLRKLEQLGHGPALGDAFRAEGDLDVPTDLRDEFLHQRGHARIDGAAQDQQLAVDETV